MSSARENRRRRPELRLWWSKRDQDYVYDYDANRGRWWLHIFLMQGVGGSATGDPRKPIDALRSELRELGYDPDTLRISVRRLREVSR